MRVTVEGDRHSVTYNCVGCTARITLDTAQAARVGASFVHAHRDCDHDPASAPSADPAPGHPRSCQTLWSL